MNSLSHLPIKTIFQIADGYKLSHWSALPEDTTHVFSNMTPRNSRIPHLNKVMVFGLQYAIKEIHQMFDDFFFDIPVEDVIKGYSDLWQQYFGTEPLAENVRRITNLHSYGSLPIEIHSLVEGTYCPIGVPFWLVRNTHADFPWVTNFIETMFSSLVWKLVTNATISAEYKKNYLAFCNETSDLDFMPDFQGHDFSMRGMSGINDAASSGMAWLLNFKGSDSMPAIAAVEYYYPLSNSDTMIATSVPASEHSLQCSYLVDTDDTELSDRNYVSSMLKTYPTGIVSVVSDGFDFWRLVTKTLVDLKPEILARNGKLVVRPDSSPKTPVEIIIGDPEASTEWERKGLIECLWDIFGGTVNSKGYKELDQHIGAIYGDSITLDYQVRILQGLKEKGFSSTNILLGTGSYSLQFSTRDTFGMAIKATAMEIKGRTVPIYKDPKTDKGEKKSAKGYLGVTKNLATGAIELLQSCNSYEEAVNCPGSLMVKTYSDGVFYNQLNWEQVTLNALESILSS